MWDKGLDCHFRDSTPHICVRPQIHTWSSEPKTMRALSVIWHVTWPGSETKRQERQSKSSKSGIVLMCTRHSSSQVSSCMTPDILYPRVWKHVCERVLDQRWQMYRCCWDLGVTLTLNLQNWPRMYIVLSVQDEVDMFDWMGLVPKGAQLVFISPRWWWWRNLGIR